MRLRNTLSTVGVLACLSTVGWLGSTVLLPTMSAAASVKSVTAASAKIALTGDIKMSLGTGSHAPFASQVSCASKVSGHVAGTNLDHVSLLFAAMSTKSASISAWEISAWETGNGTWSAAPSSKRHVSLTDRAPSGSILHTWNDTGGGSGSITFRANGRSGTLNVTLNGVSTRGSATSGSVHVQDSWTCG